MSITPPGDEGETAAETGSVRQDAAPAVRDAPETFGALERVSLAAHLALITQRLATIEDRVSQKPADGAPHSTVLEFAKVLLGGWPAFGLLFMLLFYTPVRDAINAIPEKVRSAEEIGVLGVSLKSTIRAEAEKVGAIQLSETLPSLSPPAIEFLLRGSREFNGLVAFNKTAGQLTEVWLPNTRTLKLLGELESKKLIAIQLDMNGKAGDAAALERAVAAFTKQYPGREEENGERDRVHLTLAAPANVDAPIYNWHLTELGRNAVDIILKAVSTQLAPQPNRSDRASK